MAQLAFMTFGVLYEPRSHPRSKGFIDRIPAAYEAAERSEGFIDRSHLDEDTGMHSWGESVCPAFLSEDLHPHVAHTLTLWTDLESVFAYAYSDLHAEALRQRREWFRDPQYPNYVAWWVADDHTPSFRESTRRLERLQAEGPGPDAFNFKRPFDAAGAPADLDREIVKDKIRRNAEAR